MRIRSAQLAGGNAGPGWFKLMDRNHDGDLSRREFFGRPADFDAADADHDGLLTPDEAEKMPAAEGAIPAASSK